MQKILNVWQRDTWIYDIPRWHRAFLGQSWSVVYLYRPTRSVDIDGAKAHNIVWEYHYHNVQNGIKLYTSHVDEAKKIIDARLIADGFKIIESKYAIML